MNKKIKVILILICIAIIIAVAFIVAKDKLNTNNSNENVVGKENQTNQVKEETEAAEDLGQTVSVSIDDDTVLDLINYVAPVNTSSELIFYQSKKVKLENLDNKLKLYTIFHNLEDEDADSKKEMKDENGEKVTHYYYTKDTVEKMAKKIFGPNATVNHESCEMYFGEAIDYKDGTYDRHEYEGGGATPYETSFSVVLRAEKNDKYMYIYEKYVHLIEITEEKEDETVTLGYDIYDSSDKANKLAEKVNFEKQEISLDDDEDELKDIERFLGKEIVTYRNTYKLGEDGKYYWYSTEQVK